jgi:AAA domain-containing protein
MMPNRSSQSKAASKANYRTVAAIAVAKRLDPAWLAELGVADLSGGGIQISYFGEDGEELFRRQRGQPGGPRFQQPAGVPLRLYGLWRLDCCRKSGSAFLCEGESDCWAMWDAKQPALGIPGKDAARCIQLADVDDLSDLYVLPDNQPAGDAEKFLSAVAKQLAAIHWQGRLWRVAVPESFKDVSDWRAQDPARFKEELTAAHSNRQRVELPETPSKRHESNGRESGGSSYCEPPEIRTTCAAAVKPKPLRWLVPDMLPLGKLTLLAGDGGLGKSVITIDLAARLSRGESAFGLEYPGIAGDTLIASCEDDPADTAVPRLLAAGADLTRIHFLDGVGTDENGRPAPWSLAHHAALDKHLSAHPNIRLFIIDPASAFAGMAGIDGHKDAELRALLGPLTEVAARHAATGLLVAHLGKNETARAVRRVLGSVAWVNAVRAAWIVAEREEDAGKRLLLPVKANLAPRRRGLVYQLIPLSEPEQDLALAGIDGLTAEDFDRLKRQLFRVVWLGETDAEADKVFAAAARRPEPPSDIKRAADWLKDRLKNGRVESESCVRDGNAALNLSKPLKWWRDTILKGELQGKPRKDGFNGGWTWTLRDSWDSSDSSSETSEKQGGPAGVAANGTMQKHRETDEESQESQESKRSSGWTAPGADQAALQTPFDTNGEPHE